MGKMTKLRSWYGGDLWICLDSVEAVSPHWQAWAINPSKDDTGAVLATVKGNQFVVRESVADIVAMMAGEEPRQADPEEVATASSDLMEQRIAAVAIAFKRYDDEKNGYSSSEPKQGVMVDLLTDMMHYVSRTPYDMDDLLRCAYRHYKTELGHLPDRLISCLEPQRGGE